jgi:hypothetical protein
MLHTFAFLVTPRHHPLLKFFASSLRGEGTACALTGLNDANGVNCCGVPFDDSIAPREYRGYFLTGGGSFSGVDFW